MRKLLLGAVAALVASLGVVGVASAIFDGTQTLEVKLTNNKAGTKDKPKSVGSLKVTTRTTPGPTSPAGSFTATKAVIFFDKNLVFSPKTFKVCKVNLNDASGIASIDSKCASAKVGSGTAKGEALGQVEALTVKAYNGPKVGANYKFYLHVTGSTPLVIDDVISATLKRATGDYGYKLDVPIPEGLQRPSGVLATLSEFITSVTGTSKGVPYVGLKGCSGGKLKFKGVFTYTDNTSKTATTTVPCKK
jgi:hypothetical protein